MTDNTKLTNIEPGHNAFTSTARSTLITPRELGAAKRGPKQTAHVAKQRAAGLDIGTFHGVSEKADEMIRKHNAITRFKSAPTFNVTLATADASRRTAAIKGR